MQLLRNKFAIIWLFGLSAAAAVWIFSALPMEPLARINTLVFDTYQRLKPRIWAGSDVTIIDIDEASLKRVGQWPWPRTLVAEITDKLGELGAATIVFDVIFSEADRTSPLKAIDGLRDAGAQIALPAKTDILDNDKVLARSFARHPVITAIVLTGEGSSEPPPPKAGYGFSGTEPAHLMIEGQRAIRNLPALDEPARGIGDISYLPTDDSVVRKAVLMSPVNGFYYPSLAMEALRVAQGAGGFKIKSSDGSGEISGGEITMVAVQVGALTVPTDAVGALNIYHSPLANKPTLSAKDVLFRKESTVSDEALSVAVANHIVLIGTSAKGLLDLRTTPLEPVVPGVTIHAEIIDQIISGTYLSRPDFSNGLELLVAIVGVLILLLLLPILNSIGDALATLVLLALVIGGFWIAFASYQFLFSPVVPVLSLIAAYAAGGAGSFLVTEKEGRFVREAFGHYLSPSLVEKLANNPEELTLGGEERELTILFCDIRGFTSLSEGLGPTELTDLLNSFLTPMTTVLLERGATIDKYMGDAIMAFWNAPISQENHRELACQGMLDMRRELEKLNAKSRRPIHIGIGLNTGSCCVGNLGSTQRFNYSAIGDAVNVASRVEGLTKFYGLDNLVAEDTLNGTEKIAALEVDRVSVVGREQALTVFTILGKTSDEPRADAHREAHDVMIDAYQNGDVETALVAMSTAQSRAEPHMIKLYAIYAERLGIMREQGVPDDWDGIYRATSK